MQFQDFLGKIFAFFSAWKRKTARPKVNKRRMQRLGGPAAESAGRSSPMSESMRNLLRLNKYRSRKARQALSQAYLSGASCKNVGMFFGKGGFLFTTMEFLRCFPEKIQEMGKISFKGGIFPEKRA